MKTADQLLKQICEQEELKCPKCNGEIFERVMDAKVIDRAYYEDGQLVLKQDHFEVHESYVCCAGCKLQEFSNDLAAQIEELFL